MIDGKDFLEQRKADVADSRLLYNANDYGNAAYHLQQAVEKHTKAILLYGNLMKGGKTHLPLSKFIDDLLPAFHNLEQMAKSHRGTIVENITPDSKTSQFLTQGQVIIKKLAEKDKSFKMALWKNSLGVPLLKEEEEVFRQCPLFRKYYKFNLSKTLLFPGNTPDRDNFWKHASSNQDMKKLYYYQPIVELGRMMAATFPHEDIGRYPTEIKITDGIENSTDLYKQHRDILKKLIETAEGYLMKQPSKKQMIVI